MPEMKGHMPRSVVFLTVALMLALPAPSSAQSREELNNYQEKELTAADFSLQGLDGETYTLSDFLGKVVVLEAGSST